MNTTKVKELWEKIKGFFKNMSTKVRIILCAVAVLIVVALVALVVVFNNQPYTTLFTGLSNSEASAILDYLSENGITDCRLEGNTIYVREGTQDVLAAQLALAGYPKDGYLYETYFEHVGLTTTNSERNETLRIALEQRLEAIIRNFYGVRNAQVDIALGQEQIYVLQSVQSESTASVFVELDSGYMLTDEQAAGIRNLVAHSVQNLDISNVVITDGYGNGYNADNVANLNDSSQLKVALQEYYANKIRTGVVRLLTPIYGPNNVIAEVSCTVDVNRRIIESEEFSQPEGSAENSGLIGTSTILGIVSDEGVDVVGGIPGTTTNSDVDIPTYMEDLLQNAGEGNFAEWYKDYEAHVNKTTEQVEVIAGTVTDIHVAVTINANSPNGASVDENDLRYQVAIGAGIGGETLEDSANRVAVLIAPFYEEPTPVDPIGVLITQDMIPFMIIGGAVLLVILIMLIVILSVRRKRKEKKEAEQAAIDAQLGLGEGEPGEDGVLPGEGGLPGEPAPTTGADIMEINTEKSMELRKTIRQFVQNNPEIAAQMIKSWLKGGDDDNG